MSPEHARLAILLQEAAQKRGSQAALARDLELTKAAVSDLINSKRFVTVNQALRIEEVLGVSARELLIEACVAKVDEELERVRGQ
ncbi:MAG TPA: helix-turn-helix domain-containing protein [Rhodopila sp.]|jgi:plasmid maintenance system antidote protein VapI|nr:helix-turn-helix domain-containing protein [Rhodopila sp.]